MSAKNATVRIRNTRSDTASTPVSTSLNGEQGDTLGAEKGLARRCKRLPNAAVANDFLVECLATFAGFLKGRKAPLQKG